MSEDATPKVLGPIRLAIGLVQGVALWLIFDAAKFDRLPDQVCAPIQLVALFAPLILIGGWRAIALQPLMIWTIAAAAVLAGLGAWDEARGMEDFYDRDRQRPSPELIAAAGVGLFVAHHLVEVGLRARRAIGPFPDYFDTGWKHGVQLALSACFVGALWLLLILGAALFKAIGVDEVSETIQRSWFAWPTTAVALAGAIHLTDVRANLVRGVRLVALTLLSWLLPLLTAIITPFLVALLILGLDRLLGEVSAAALLLSAAAALIILINATYQDGEATPPLVLRWTARLACLLLMPLIGLAAYAIALRIGQHGLTPERVVAAALVIVGFCHAAGYFWAAVIIKGPWLRRLELTNILSAMIALAVLLALFSPLADPARLSVTNQMARLKAGAAKAETFDYDFLRFRSGRAGREAIKALAQSGAGPQRDLVKARALAAQARTNAWSSTDEPQRKRLTPSDVAIFPTGRTLPAHFFEVRQPSDNDVRESCLIQASCNAYLLDLDGDRQEEVVLSPGGFLPTVYALNSDGDWIVAAKINASCGGGWSTEAPPEIVPPKSRFDEILVGRRRFRVTPAPDCAKDVPAASTVR